MLNHACFMKMTADVDTQYSGINCAHVAMNPRPVGLLTPCGGFGGGSRKIVWSALIGVHSWLRKVRYGTAMPFAV